MMIASGTGAPRHSPAERETALAALRRLLRQHYVDPILADRPWLAGAFVVMPSED